MNSYQNSKIKNVLLIGLGGVGTVYANLLSKNDFVDLRILTDKTRYQAYKKTPRRLNGIPLDFKYILPDEKFSADLVIIATKSGGFNNAVDMIAPFVSENTYILSLVNGVTSEEILMERYKTATVFYSYVICHTVARTKNDVSHDGMTKIVFGMENNEKEEEQKVLADFFDKCNIYYGISDDIKKELWEKFCFNCCANQISAITGATFKQMLYSEECVELIKNMSEEIQSVAIAHGIKAKDMAAGTLEKLKLMVPSAKTSMLQDFENKTEPETELFGEALIEKASEKNVAIPYNTAVYQLLQLNYTTKYKD